MTEAIDPHAPRRQGAARLLWALGLGLLLAACATPRPEPAVPPEALFEDRLDALAALSGWAVSGRAGISAGTEAATMSLDWRQMAGDWQLDLRGPLASGSVRLQRTAAGVSLRTGDGRSDQADDAQALLHRYTGFDLPVEVLQDWLIGIPAPEYDARLDLDDDGLPVRVEQLGWVIQYTAYDRVNGVQMPVRVFMDGPGVAVRVSVSRWELFRD
ncbi:MAG: outer membrane lipoprotein LolB [Ectothiorhodospiraceae bacterium]|nr:outer membrane lipoprotein LolB [Ectothiorhodospiraceae bacterium]